MRLQALSGPPVRRMNAQAAGKLGLHPEEAALLRRASLVMGRALLRDHF